MPRDFVNDGKVALNISPTAIVDLELGGEWIYFSARFSGSPFQVSVPVHAVLAIYAMENGRGMIFPEEEPKAGSSERKDKQVSRPHLRLIK
ncbi:MAG: ClpXP protease specificity-enhancing factor SspB [Gammaproteobacteria bacterium]